MSDRVQPVGREKILRGASIDLTSALFQSSIWLESTYPAGTPEHEIARVCWKAFEVLSKPNEGPKR